MPLSDYVLDGGLTKLDTESDRFDVCAGEPTTYAEATTGGNKSLGNKTITRGTLCGSPANTPTRHVVVVAISDGTETNAGTVTHWAISDTTNSRLLATGPVSTRSLVGSGNFTTPSFNITLPVS